MGRGFDGRKSSEIRNLHHFACGVDTDRPWPCPTGPKRMERVDQEFLKSTLDFIDRSHKSGKLLQSFKEFPPRAKPGLFSVGKVLDTLYRNSNGAE
jgi:hypothetical protein